MPDTRKFYTTAQVCEKLGTYGTRVWSLIGRGLSAPVRVGAKLVYWYADEVDRLAELEALARKKTE